MRAVAVGTALLVTLGFTSVTATAQTWRPPTDSQRCPSKWGAGDERGAGNHMTPATVLRAAHQIKTGEAIELAHPLAPGSASRRSAR